MCFLDSVYKALIISTIVDFVPLQVLPVAVYKALIISTIVDCINDVYSEHCL